MNLLRISWQSLPDLYSRILPEGDPEAQGLRAGWGAIFEWLRTQELTTQIGIIAGMVAVGYITYRFFFSSDGGAPGAGGPGGDDDEGGANPPDHQNIQPVNIALNNPPAGGLGHEAARYAAAAAVVGGLGHMQDRAMNPDRANAQANPNPNPNPNQQQQHQPEASVEVVVEAVGQAVAEQPPVYGQPILHEAIMNPIIPQPDQPMNPQGDAEQPPVDEQHPQAEEQQAILHGAIINPIIAQPRVDEQHPEAAEQANIAPEAEDEGEEPIIHQPIPQGEAIINPQGDIIHAEQVEAIAQQMVAIVQAEGQEPIIPAEQPIIADVEVDVQLDIVPEPIEAITTRPEVLPILGENVPFPRETITTLNRPSAVESLMTQPSQVPTIPQPTAEAMPSTDTTPQMPETQAIVTPQSSTSTTNTLTKSAKRRLKEREKALAKVEAEALAKAEAEAKKVKEAEKGKSKETSTASRDLSLDPNNNNNQATSSRDVGMGLNNRASSSRAKDPNNNNARVLNPLLISTRDLEGLMGSAPMSKASMFRASAKASILKKELETEFDKLESAIRSDLTDSSKEYLGLLELCNQYLAEPTDKDCLNRIKYLICYLKIKQKRLFLGSDFFAIRTMENTLEFLYNVPLLSEEETVAIVNTLLDAALMLFKTDSITDSELKCVFESLIDNAFSPIAPWEAFL